MYFSPIYRQRHAILSRRTANGGNATSLGQPFSLVSGALLQPAATHMWFIRMPPNEQQQQQLIVLCAAHSLLSATPTTFQWRSRQVQEDVKRHGLEFFVPNARVLQDAQPQTDFAFARVQPPALQQWHTEVLHCVDQRLTQPTDLQFVFQHRFDFDGKRYKDNKYPIGTHDVLAIPHTNGICHLWDTGFPGMSGAAGVVQGVLGRPKFAALSKWDVISA